MKVHDCWNHIGVRGDGSCPELQKHVHCRNCPVYSAAASELLDLPVSDEYRASWTNHFRAEKQAGIEGTDSIMIFRLGSEWLGVSAGIFREVCDVRSIHTLPHRRNEVVLGIVNVRGSLVVCVSLNSLLGIDRGAAVKQGGNQLVQERLLVAEVEGGRLAFPVDEVHGIHRYNPVQLGAVPSTVSKSTATYTRAMLEWRDRAVGVLDDQLLFYSLNKNLA